MRHDWMHLEANRWQDGPLGPSPVGAHYGAFRFVKGGTRFQIIAADGEETGWEHVSMTVAYQITKAWTPRLPKWDEMAWLKSLFWDEDECVIQFHPPKSEYVNNHATCLHLWKCVAVPFPLPPTELVGIK